MLLLSGNLEVERHLLGDRQVTLVPKAFPVSQFPLEEALEQKRDQADSRVRGTPIRDRRETSERAQPPTAAL